MSTRSIKQSSKNEEGNKNNFIVSRFKGISEVLEDVPKEKFEDETEISSSYESSTNKNEGAIYESYAIEVATTTEEVSNEEFDTTENVSIEVTTEMEETIEEMFELNENKSEEESNSEKPEESNEESSEESEEEDNSKQIDINSNLVASGEGNSKEIIDEKLEKSDVFENLGSIGVSNRFGSSNQNLETTTNSDLISITTSNSDDTYSETSDETSDKSTSTISNNNVDETTTVFNQNNNIHDSFTASTAGSFKIVGNNELSQTETVVTIGGRINTASPGSNIIESTNIDTITNSISNIASDTTESFKDTVTTDKTASNDFLKSENDDSRTTTKGSITIINDVTTSTEATSIRSDSGRSFDFNGRNQFDIFNGITSKTQSNSITEKPNVIDTSLAQHIVKTPPITSFGALNNRIGLEETTTVTYEKVSLANDILPPKLNSESKSETSTDDGLVKAVFTGEVVLDDPITDSTPQKGFFFNFQSLGAYNLASLTRNSHSSFAKPTTPAATKSTQSPRRINNKKNGEHMPDFSLGLINKYTGSDLHIDTINLGNTGSINRLDGSNSMFFKGFHIHQPTYGKYL